MDVDISHVSSRGSGVVIFTKMYVKIIPIYISKTCYNTICVRHRVYGIINAFLPQTKSRSRRKVRVGSVGRTSIRSHDPIRSSTRSTPLKMFASARAFARAVNVTTAAPRSSVTTTTRAAAGDVWMPGSARPKYLDGSAPGCVRLDSTRARACVFLES